MNFPPDLSKFCAFVGWYYVVAVIIIIIDTIIVGYTASLCLGLGWRAHLAQHYQSLYDIMTLLNDFKGIKCDECMYTTQANTAD